MKTIKRFVGYVVEPLWAMLVYFIVIVCGDSLKDLRNVGKNFIERMHNFAGNSWGWYVKSIKHKKQYEEMDRVGKMMVYGEISIDGYDRLMKEIWK